MSFYLYAALLAIPLFVIAHFGPEISHAVAVRKRARRIKRYRDKKKVPFRGMMVLGQEYTDYLN